MTKRTPREELTDLGNARRLVLLHGHDLRHVHEWGWMAWDGTRWRRDNTGEAERRAKETVRAILREAATETDDKQSLLLTKHALASQRAGSIRAMLELARTEREIVARPEEFDTHSDLLNVANGTIDLTTGALRSHARADHITKIVETPYDPSAQCPQWDAHLLKVMAGREDLVSFLQRSVGYSLTGRTDEQCLLFLHGSGANGKGTTIRTLEALFGDYFRAADFGTFLERRSEAIREDIADLVGARMVVASEAGEGRRLDEGLVKTLTGQDTVSCRFLRRDRFNYRPHFKLWLVANHRPRIRGTDLGIWRRIYLVPFDVTIPDHEKDPTLERSLLRELPGVLRWAVEGCQLWLEDGLRVPDAVRIATAQYREESDSLGAFLRDCCDITPNVREFAGSLHKAYARWADEQGEPKLSSQSLGRKLAERGFPQLKSNGKVYRIGIRLSAEVPISTDFRLGSHEEKIQHELPEPTVLNGTTVLTNGVNGRSAHSERAITREHLAPEGAR